MGFHSGPTVVNDSLVFCFDAGSDKCTDADDAVTSMRDIAPVAHSSRSDRGITGAGITGNMSFPTDTGAAKAINTGVTWRRSDDDPADPSNFDNRLGLDDEILFADQDAWSCEFWAKPDSDAEHTFLSLAGRGATSPWLIWQHGSSTWYPRYRDNNGNYYRDSSDTNVSGPDDWHQIVFTADTSRNIGFYVDGALLGGTTQAADTQFEIDRIMAGYASGTARYGFQGSMLCARIYAKTLSAAEVLQNFNATRGRVGI
tara:strand:- start:601 stop:1371 length:771 start_codon:yes stop_codon:yes gene_type:complete